MPYGVGFPILLGVIWLWSAAALWPPLNHDVAAVLHWADRMLGGERLYVDLIDVNPPMVFWLSAIPAALARLTGLPAAACLSGFFLLLFAGATWFAGALLRPLLAARPASATLLPVATLALLLIYPAHSFGQREHLLFGLALPYLAAAARRVEGAPPDHATSVLATLVLGIGFCLKPHFVLVPAAVELYLLARRGWRASLADPAPWTILATGLLYLAAVWRITPEYITRILPLAFGHYTEFEGSTFGSLLRGDQVPTLVIGGVALALLSMRPGGSKSLGLLGAFVLAATLSGVIQAKGWDYHFLAARSGLLLWLVALVAAQLDSVLPPRRAALVAGAALLGFMLLDGRLAPPFKLQSDYAGTPAGRMEALVRREGADRPVMWLTTSIYPHFPALVHAGVPLASHYMSMWLLPALYEHAAVGPDNQFVYRKPEEMSADERALYDHVAADLVRWQPGLVIVTRSSDDPGFRGHGFDYLAYFRRNPDFASAFASYRQVEQVEGWTIYKRD